MRKLILREAEQAIQVITVKDWQGWEVNPDNGIEGCVSVIYLILYPSKNGTKAAMMSSIREEMHVRKRELYGKN
jgi:hypothetical protein